MLQDLFFVLTMLSLAQFWNLLAGYAGIISVGQQAFVGLGGYLLFALTILAGLDPVRRDRCSPACVAAADRRCRRRCLVFRLNGAYFAVGTWVVAEVFRLVLAQVKSLGGGTGDRRCRRTSPTTRPSVTCVAALTGDCAPRSRATWPLYWLALILAVGDDRAGLWPAALAARPGAGGDPRQRGGGGLGRRRRDARQAAGSMSSRASAPA